MIKRGTYPALFRPLWGPPPSHLELETQDVHLWLISFERIADTIGEMSRLLSHDEGTRAARFYFERDRRRFILSRGILRMLLALYLSVDPHKVRFCPGTYGKPNLGDEHFDSGVQFSLSRTRRFSLLGITRGRSIGVDIEEIRPMQDVEQLASQIFSQNENLEWDSLPNQLKETAFFRGFVCKEACIKAMGMGFFQPPEQVEFSLEPKISRTVARINGCVAEASRWSLLEIQPADGHVAALVNEHGTCRISYYTWQSQNGP